VDIVDNQIFNDTRQLVFEYLQEQLEAVYVELMVEHMVNEAKGLQTIWSTANQRFASEIKNHDGKYSSLAALCYGECRPLWVVGDDRAPLRSATRCNDMWSGQADLPKYRSRSSGISTHRWSSRFAGQVIACSAS
jgi:hypothetical protein